MARTSGPAETGSRPSTSKRPPSGWVRPSDRPRRVVWPAPLAPRRPVMPSATSTVTPLSAVTAPNFFTTPSAERMAATGPQPYRPAWCGDGRASVPVMPERSLELRSHDVTTGVEKSAARAMLRAVGMTDGDWDKPQIGVASAWNAVTPCNLTLRKLAERSKEGIRAAGGFPLEFGTITVSDGISMGHEGMRASLVSREVITDSVECVV